MHDDRLARNFWLSEFLASQTAMRKGIDNTPGLEHQLNIREHLAPGMQRIRDLLGAPVIITSGYRCPQLNAAIGGSRASQHMQGLAADFTAPSFGAPREICLLLVDREDAIRFDQLIYEGAWVHVSFAAAPRGSILTAHFQGGGVSYSRGISA